MRPYNPSSMERSAGRAITLPLSVLGQARCQRNGLRIFCANIPTALNAGNMLTNFKLSTCRMATRHRVISDLSDVGNVESRGSYVAGMVML
jgi:hypothetical protein